MTEPTTSTVSTTGVLILLSGWLGEIGADVTMVLMASLAGASLSLSRHYGGIASSIYLCIVSMVISLSSAWGLAPIAISCNSNLNTPYLPSLIALITGMTTSHLLELLECIIEWLKRKLV